MAIGLFIAAIACYLSFSFWLMLNVVKPIAEQIGKSYSQLLALEILFNPSEEQLAAISRLELGSKIKTSQILATFAYSLLAVGVFAIFISTSMDSHNACSRGSTGPNCSRQAK